jgi:AraC-like DNA-binding protein
MSEELSEILSYIDAHVCEKLTLDLLEKELFISKSTIERRFQEELNLNPSEFIRKRKLIIAANMLLNGASVLDAGNSVGYADNSHFIKLFKEYFGQTPSKYKKKQQSE